MLILFTKNGTPQSVILIPYYKVIPYPEIQLYVPSHWELKTVC